jgi:Na+/proline symporter
VLSVALGLWTSLRVKTANDFALAGRALPFHIVTATVFATWFGSETILGIPATFLQEGMKGIISDPFGSSLCLILVGLFFAKPLYRMRLLTIGDFYKQRYGRTAEIITTFCIVVSYLGWVAAQIKALGLVFHVISDGALTQETGMLIGAASVLVYTLFGGMWSVAITDFVQMIVIVIGMLYIGVEVGGQAGGFSAVVARASLDGKLQIMPTVDWIHLLGFVSALCTMMLGSIPQQDVFQRVGSSKNEKIASTASITGGILYFFFAFVPIFLVYCAVIIAPDLVNMHMKGDPQLILPQFIMQHAPMFAQIVFFGALLSAIKSCASATLLAPSVTFAENIIRPLMPHLNPKQLLRLMQMIVLLFAVFVTMFALNSTQSIFEMVESAYSVTLVSSFVPLTFGLFWKKANRAGGLLSITAGLFTWICASIWFTSSSVSPQLAGLMASFIGMFLGTYLGNLINREVPNHAVVTNHSIGLTNNKASKVSSISGNIVRKNLNPNINSNTNNKSMPKGLNRTDIQLKPNSAVKKPNINNVDEKE